MSRPNPDFLFGTCVAALGGLMVLLPAVFRASFDPYGGAVVSSNMQMFGAVIGFVGLVLLIHAALKRLGAEPTALPRGTPAGARPA